MSIDRINHPWGETGALDTTLTDDKRDVGWVSGDSPDRPTIERFNLLQNEDDNKFNEMLDNGPKRPMKTSTSDQLFTGLYPAGVSAIDSTMSVDTSKGTADFYDYAYAEISGVKKIIACDDDTALNVDIIDIDTMSFDGSQALPSASLPATYTWVPVGITCSSDIAYILFVDSAVAVEWRIQAYDTTSWTVAAGWPATGTDPFAGTGTVFHPSVIHATDSLLAIANPNVTVSASTDPAVVFIDKTDGTIDSSGAGDQTSGGGPDRICSNGTYVFTSDGYSINISSPSSGCGGTNWPRSISSNDVACIGDLVVFTTDTTNILYVSSVTNALIGTVTSGDNSICKGTGRITTDGLYFWATGNRTVGATDRLSIFKVDPYRLTAENSSTIETVGEEIVTPIAINSTATHTTSLSAESPPIIYDGESMWCTLNQTNYGVFHRVSRTNLR